MKKMTTGQKLIAVGAMSAVVCVGTILSEVLPSASVVAQGIAMLVTLAGVIVNEFEIRKQPQSES